MTDDTKDIVIPILRNLQTDMSMLKEAVRRIDARIGTMESYMAGFHNSLRWQGDELDTQRGRLEALEEKLRPQTPPENI